ncbi:MAG: hypothetical protein LBE44_09200, partial [Microbacterium hominis]|nr:hypothetical protein [Microbacterium hominis]
MQSEALIGLSAISGEPAKTSDIPEGPILVETHFTTNSQYGDRPLCTEYFFIFIFILFLLFFLTLVQGGFYSSTALIV